MRYACLPVHRSRNIQTWSAKFTEFGRSSGILKHRNTSNDGAAVLLREQASGVYLRFVRLSFS